MIRGTRWRGACWRGSRRWLAGFALLAGTGAYAANDGTLPVARLSAGMYLIHAEVAQSPDALQRGLMFRTELGDQSGMLFMFPAHGTQCMWMRNTLIPLSVAFLHDDGTIANVEDMTPQTEDSHCSVAPVRMALEMNAGWFAKRGLGPGTRIKGLPER